MTPYQVLSEIYGGFFYSGITLKQSWKDGTWGDAQPKQRNIFSQSKTQPCIASEWLYLLTADQ